MKSVTELKELIDNAMVNHSFFENRKLVNVNEQNTSLLTINYKDNENDILSTILINSTNVANENYILLLSMGNMVVFDSVGSLITIKLNDSKTEIEKPINFSEEEFFQESIIHNLGAIMYEHIELCRELNSMVSDYYNENN